MFKVMLISVAAFILSGCMSLSTKLTGADGLETTEAIMLISALERSTNQCWANYVDQQEKAAHKSDWDMDVNELSKLSASAQVEYIRQMSTGRIVAALVEALRPQVAAPCQSMDKIMVSYYNAVGRVAASNSAVYQRALGVAGVVGGIWAAGNAIEGIVANANAPTINQGIFGTPGNSSSGGKMVGGTNTVTIEGATNAGRGVAQTGEGQVLTGRDAQIQSGGEGVQGQNFSDPINAPSQSGDTPTFNSDTSAFTQ